MKMKFYLSLLLCCLALPMMAGQEISGTLSVGGVERNYIGYLPDNLGQNRPLLISCHGANQDAAYQKGMLNIESVADTARFLTIFPNGIDRSWDIGGDRDINYVKAIIDEMVSKYKINRKRVYLSGFSMGGMLTYHAMNRIADKIAAFAPISGYPMYGSATADASVRPIPIIHTHGTGDDVVKFDGVQEVLNLWINHNGCPTSAKVVNNYRGAPHITRRTWAPGKNNVEVVLMELTDKGHWISNDNGVLTGDEIWKFCKRYSTDGMVTQDDALPALHVEGKWLVNEFGDQVTLHGVMDTPSAYFNGGRWGWSYDDAGRLRCLDYFEKIFTGLEKANCDVFRLHLEPAWTNDNSYTYTTAQPDDEAKGEADIRHFNPNRLKTYLTSLYIPLMQKAMAHGQYVVVRPPGVCPQNLKVGDYYQQYLLEVWDIVSQQAAIQEYAGQISLELANEPVNLKDKNGNDNAKALHDYFQPIVNKIRENGFTGIIWIPGTGWQSNYTSYKTYPITGDNIGYAVHDYTGWYGCSDATPDPQNKINNFHNQVPVVDNYPIIITEVDWSPEDPNAQGHYNEHGQWVVPNLGTWSTGSTSKWGKAYRAMLDHFGNISMTLSGTGCLIDIDQLIDNGVVTAAFGGNPEACGKACMDWYAEWKGIQLIEGFGEEITSMDDITNGNRFMIGDGNNVLNFETSQNAISQPVTSLPLSSYYYYTLTKIDGYDDVYAVNIIDKDGTPFPAPYNLGSNLNISMYGGIIFSGSAKADKYGTDFDNGGLWQVEYVDGEGFTFRSMNVSDDYSGRYMNMAGTQDGVAYMHLYKGVKMLGDDAADDQIFAMSKATGFDAETGMLTGGWVFDEPVDISRWDYLMIMTSNTAADESHSVVITDANGKVARADGYKGSDAGTGGNMWLDRWNNQNAIRISIEYLKKTLDMDVSRIKALEFKAWGDAYFPVSVSCVYLTDFNNTKVGGGYANGDVVREYNEPGHFGTICLPFTAACAGGVAYSIAGISANSVSLTPVDGLMKAGTPYIYIGTDVVGAWNEGKVRNVNFFRADKTDYDVSAPVASNGLIGSFKGMTVPQGDDIYVLNGNKLYYTTDANVTIDANKAYIDGSQVADLAAGRLFIGFGSEATGIVDAPLQSKVGLGEMFNLNGQRVAAPRRGLYIINGKKAVIRQ